MVLILNRCGISNKIVSYWTCSVMEQETSGFVKKDLLLNWRQLLLEVLAIENNYSVLVIMY